MKIKKMDITLIAIILVMATIFQFYNSTKTAGNSVQIYAENELFGEYSLSKDQVIEVVNNENHINVIEISKGSVFVREADCPDKICVRHNKVSKTGATIVCIPNKVSIKVLGHVDEVDAVSL